MKGFDKTNEKLTQLFRNNFELAMYAIEIARRNIRAGRDFSLKSLLKEVENNPLKGDFEDLIREIAEEQETQSEQNEDDVA